MVVIAENISRLWGFGCNAAKYYVRATFLCAFRLTAIWYGQTTFSFESHKKNMSLRTYIPAIRTEKLSVVDLFRNFVRPV